MNSEHVGIKHYAQASVCDIIWKTKNSRYGTYTHYLKHNQYCLRTTIQKQPEIIE